MEEIFLVLALYLNFCYLCFNLHTAIIKPLNSVIVNRGTNPKIKNDILLIICRWKSIYGWLQLTWSTWKRDLESGSLCRFGNNNINIIAFFFHSFLNNYRLFWVMIWKWIESDGLQGNVEHSRSEDHNLLRLEVLNRAL